MIVTNVLCNHRVALPKVRVSGVRFVRAQAKNSMNKTTTTRNNSNNKISTTIPSAPKIRMTVGQHKFDS